MKIFTPEDAKQRHVASIPDFVIKAINELLSENYKDQGFSIPQDTIITRILRYSPEEITRSSIFSNRWLDIEDLYRQNGWEVEYDKPAYNESYSARFIFKPKQSI